jgi:hypothetical protein
MAETVLREKRLISLNSSSATRYNNGTFKSDVVFDFGSILSPDSSIIYIECGVQSAEIVASFYNINSSNNTFNYTITAVNYSINVTPGSYNYNTLVSELVVRFATNGHSFTYALNRNTNVFTMTYTGVGTWQTVRPSSIYYIFGFLANTTYTVVGNTLTYPGLFNVINPKKLKIFSQNMAIDSFDSVGLVTNNLIETLSVNAPPFGLILYNNVDSTYGHLRTSYLSTIDIQIRNELGDFIDFNNIDWTITIVLIVYKKLETKSIELVQPGNELGNNPTV